MTGNQEENLGSSARLYIAGLSKFSFGDALSLRPFSALLERGRDSRVTDKRSKCMLRKLVLDRHCLPWPQYSWPLS